MGKMYVYLESMKVGLEANWENCQGLSDDSQEDEGEEEDDDDDADPQYFTSNDMTDDNVNQWPGKQRRRRMSKAEREQSRGRKKIDRAGRAIPGIPETVINTPPWQLELVKAGALSDVLIGLWNKESFWGVWKGMCSRFHVDRRKKFTRIVEKEC